MIGGADWAGGPLVKALRARLGPRVAIMVGDQFDVGGLIDSAGRAAHGVYLATTEALPDAGSLTPAAARFAARFGPAARRGYRDERRRGGGGRPAGDRALRRHARVGPAVAALAPGHDGILGTFTFDRRATSLPRG